MSQPLLTAAELEPLYQAELLLDAAVDVGPDWMTFVKEVRREDPFVSGQKVLLPGFPHHLAGELFISLTAQTGAIFLRHTGRIGPSWRGHGTRIREAVFRSSVLVGERLYVEARLKKERRLWGRLFVTFAFKMWKEAGGAEVVCYTSEQEAVFFDASEAAPG